MPIGKGQIAALIPHAGAMCLLDEVTRWDDAGVSALARTHRDAANPLRIAGRLPAWSAIEYAVQAMAVHGALAGAVEGRPRAGFLVSLRNVECLEANVDGLEGDLAVEARRIAGDDERVMYAFSLAVGEREVLRGNATVILDARDGAA